MGLRSSLSWLCEGFQQRTGIPTSFEAPEKLPSFPPPAATAIFRVAQEALTNIHRHAHASRVLMRVSATFAEFRMEVTDDGQGFANLEECRQGIGILGMQERLAELGGMLQVESGAGAGSSVFATVPLLTQEMPAVPIPPQPTPRTGAARILIVDDHPAICEGVRVILGVCPDLCVCGAAASAGEALKLAQELRPDIVLLDLQLGPEDGWQVVRGLRAANSSARVLIFSHHAERFVVPAAKNAGCSGFVAKSRTASELVEAIRVVLAGGKFFPAYSLAHSA
jgi:CheY-like chemotaxis protein